LAWRVEIDPVFNGQNDPKRRDEGAPQSASSYDSDANISVPLVGDFT